MADEKSKQIEEKKNPVEKIEKTQEKADNAKSAAEEKKPDKKIESKPKKTEAVVNAQSIPVSMKRAVAVCRAIKGMTPESAEKYLENVVSMKTAVPMRGEIPHRKGNIMSGRFPRKTAGEFIRLVKSLSANANVAGIGNPIISEAIANKAQMPFGRFGAVRRKRTHIKLIAREKKEKAKQEKKKQNV